MYVPVDELLVFGPLGLAMAVYFSRSAVLAFRYRQTP